MAAALTLVLALSGHGEIATVQPSPAVAVSPSNAPAFAGDAGDPDVVYSGGTYFAFTTGTPLGNHIQELVDTSGSPESGWASYTGTTYGSTALPSTPAWEAVGPGPESQARRRPEWYHRAQW